MKFKYPDAIDILTGKIENKYLLTRLVFLRAKELNSGEVPLVEIDDMMRKDFIGIAEKEILEGAVKYTFEDEN